MAMIESIRNELATVLQQHFDAELKVFLLDQLCDQAMKERVGKTAEALERASGEYREIRAQREHAQGVLARAKRNVGRIKGRLAHAYLENPVELSAFLEGCSKQQ